jgi:transposase
LEACGSAHYWARELKAFCHEALLMRPAYTKPYVKRSKNDAADAEAICEAMSRPGMRFVPVKSVDASSDANAAYDARTSDQAADDERQCAA